MTSLLQHPQLINCRRLFLRGHEVWINIGVHDFEKKGEQRVLIDVDLYVPLAQETLADDLLRLMLAHPRVRAARVCTEKPDVYPDCDAVGVEVFGLRAEAN